MGLQKNVYTPGKWYPYFYMPPKSPEMSRYYKLVETELSRLYSFLPKDQIHGKILDFLGIPNAGGKIHKSKLHKIFLFEASSKGKKILAKLGDRADEVKMYPPKSVKPYEGPFKFFKSKNSRQFQEVRMSGKSVKKASAPSVEVTSHSDDESDIVRYLPPRSEMNARTLNSSKQDPKRPEKPYEGPFKLFKSKISRRMSEKSVEVDVQASRSNGASVLKTDMKEDCTTAPPIEVISDGSDVSDVFFVPHRAQVKKGALKSSKRAPERPSDRSGSQFRTKIVRHRHRTHSRLWYENTLSPESSRSYSVESDEDSAMNLNSSKRKNKCCSLDKNEVVKNSAGDTGRSNSRKLTQDPVAASLCAETKPKTYHILSSVDSDDDVDPMIVSKPVKESGKISGEPSAGVILPSAASGEQDLSRIFSTLCAEETVFDGSHSKRWLRGPPNDDALKADPAEKSKLHFAYSASLLSNENLPNNKFEPVRINANRKTVEFKNVEYYYYNKNSSSSVTRSSSSHRSAESKAGELKKDSSSDDNDYDTGFVSPMVLSQDSQLMSQDVMTRNTSGESRSFSLQPSSWAFERTRPSFPSGDERSSPRVCSGRTGIVGELPKNPSPVDQNRSLVLQNVQQRGYSPRSLPRVFPVSSFVEETPKNSSSADRSLVLQNVQKLRYSPVLSQELPAASQPSMSDLGMFLPDLELVKHFGTLSPVEEESLSQISAATEYFSARVMVDLRNPGALEAIHHHCRSIIEVVNSQNVASTTPRAISLAQQRPMLTPPSHKENPHLVEDSVGSLRRRLHIDSETLPAGDRRETPLTVESFHDNTDAHTEASRTRSPKNTYSQSVSEIEAGFGNKQNIAHTGTASQRSRMPSEAEESIADERGSMISQPSQPDDGSDTLMTPQQRKKLPFKKRLPLLSAPKLKIITFNEPALRTQDTTSPDKSSAPVSVRSPLAASAKANAMDSAVLNVKRSSVACVETRNPMNPDAAVFDEQSPVSNVETAVGIFAKAAAGIETTSAKGSGISANVRRSSVASVDSRNPMNQGTAASVKTSLIDTLKTATSMNSAIAASGKSSLAVGIETASAKNSAIPPIASIELRSPMNQATAANVKASLTGPVKTSGSVKSADASNSKSSAATSVKTASSLNSAAATNKSSAASIKEKSHDTQQDTLSVTAEKPNVTSHLDSKKDKTAAFQPNRGNTGCGSHSSKGSLKEWQRQANLAWKLSLPHISHQFFNDPEMTDVRFISDDVTSRSGVTWSEPSSRVKLRNVEAPLENAEHFRVDGINKNVEEPDKNLEVDPQEADDRHTTEMSGSPSPNCSPGALSPLTRGFTFSDAFNPSRSLNSNNVDPDAETQLKSQRESNMDAPSHAPSLERNYSRDLDSFLDISIASRSTADKAFPGCSRQLPAAGDQSGPSFPVWWQREYSTPKHSFLEEDSVSDDSMQVILPRSQVRRDEALNAPAPPAVDDSAAPKYDPLEAKEHHTARRPEVTDDTRSDVQRRSSAVQTRLMTKPPSSESQSAEHDFFISLVRKLNVPGKDHKEGGEQ